MFTFKLIYTIVSAILTSFLLSFAVNLYNSNVNYVRTITKTIIIAMLVIPLYVFFFFQEKVEYATLITSVYFIATDWMAFFIMKFCFEFTGRESKIKHIQWIYVFFAAVDTLSLLMNNYTHHSFWLQRAATDWGFVYWSLTLAPVHYVHLCFCYVMIIQSFFVLLVESIRAPYYYKSKFTSILLSYLLIVVVNFICYSLDLPVDLSIIFYGILATFITWCAAYRVPSKMVLFALKSVNAVIADGIFYLNVNNECIMVNDFVRNTFANDTRFDKRFATEKVLEHIKLSGEENPERLSWHEKIHVNGVLRSFAFDYEKLYYSKVQIGAFLKMIETTERDKLIDKQRYIASRDSLTGIYNRDKFFEECNKIIKDNPDERHFMLVSNIKNFKLVNEIFGRKTGDAILKMQADLIRNGAGAYEANVYGRISEDKFAIFTPAELFDPELFDNSVVALRDIIKTSNYKLQVVLGISETHGIFENAQMLYDETLLALKSMPEDYKKSYIFYSSDLMEKILLEKTVVSDFPDAIKNEDFKLHLQPIFDKNDKCVGAEALVYWKHEDFGQEGLQDFLGILEEHSLIHVLDTYVIERAVRILKEWQNNGLTDKMISVNISTKDIYHMNIYEVVTGLVKKYDVNPDNLYLEFKETLLTADAAGAKNLLSDLQKFGIKVGIDNFGRGYSSLNLLKDVRADFLKIDMLFLSESENEERSFTILKFIVSLAKTLDMTVISQGVELKSQYEILRQLGCDYMQGFYYSKPMSIREFELSYLS